MRREDGPSHAGVLRGPRPPGARHSRGIKRKSLVAFLARAESTRIFQTTVRRISTSKRPRTDGALRQPWIRVVIRTRRSRCRLRVLPRCLRRRAGVDLAGFVEALIPYMLARISWPQVVAFSALRSWSPAADERHGGRNRSVRSKQRAHPPATGTVSKQAI